MAPGIASAGGVAIVCPHGMVWAAAAAGAVPRAAAAGAGGGLRVEARWMMPNSMLQPSPISTTFAFSSRVRCDCSVALILSISALVITVAVVGFPGLGWA